MSDLFGPEQGGALEKRAPDDRKRVLIGRVGETIARWAVRQIGGEVHDGSAFKYSRCDFIVCDWPGYGSVMVNVKSYRAFTDPAFYGLWMTGMPRSMIDDYLGLQDRRKLPLVIWYADCKIARHYYAPIDEIAKPGKFPSLGFGPDVHIPFPHTRQGLTPQLLSPTFWFARTLGNWIVMPTEHVELMRPHASARTSAGKAVVGYELHDARDHERDLQAWDLEQRAKGTLLL